MTYEEGTLYVFLKSVFLELPTGPVDGYLTLNMWLPHKWNTKSSRRILQVMPTPSPLCCCAASVVHWLTPLRCAGVLEALPEGAARCAATVPLLAGNHHVCASHLPPPFYRVAHPDCLTHLGRCLAQVLLRSLLHTIAVAMDTFAERCAR